MISTETPTPEQTHAFRNWVFTEGMSRAKHYARVFASESLARALEREFRELVPEPVMERCIKP
ncbi:hypothetical protein [Amycolatopsis sp. FDAARGOS 1241]|uniref:hypothetical protein n=1 Tax=Amycolatopsis sp. FDAARGOS 1241 TaxID=2778070 RepID=UPI00194FBA90|nr:hypothetical protein [Amycolatopsis sp. FDAARGOS 1241]QRP48982.1 hypothetical protein I6J71_14955 [Amycolatopsis sp. FDAARGOS 1241]